MDGKKQLIAVSHQKALDLNRGAMAGAQAQQGSIEEQRQIREEIERLEALLKAGGAAGDQPERITIDPSDVYQDPDISQALWRQSTKEPTGP